MSETNEEIKPDAKYYNQYLITEWTTLNDAIAVRYGGRFRQFT